jgi:hypothetical protein
MSTSNRTALLLALGAAGMLAFSSCATTRQSRDVETSGFLGDYSQLKEGEGDEAQLVYIDPAAKFAQYDAVWIDTVTIWSNEETSDVSAEDQQLLTDYLYKALHEQLSQDYKVVDGPQAGAIRVRAAITDAKGARSALKTITSIVPQLRMATALVGLSAGTSVMVGKARLEGELTDSQSGHRLVAVVDTRQGTKALRGGLGKWADVEQAFEYWAQRLRTRLGELSGRAPAD